jgi:hypothetical protein
MSQCNTVRQWTPPEKEAAVVESVVSKLQETGQHVAKKSDLLFTRARDAGEAFIGEVRTAGREMVVLVRTEAKGWKRFFSQQTSRLQTEAKAALTPKSFERELLSRVDGTLRSLDAKVRARLGTLEKRPGKSVRRKATGKTKPSASGNGIANGKARPAGKSTATRSAPKPTGASLLAGARQ